MRNIKFLFIIMTLVLSKQALAITSYFIADLTASGIDDSTQTTLRELIRSAVTESGGSLAVISDKADFVLTPKVLSLGSSYLVSIHRLKGEKVIFQAKEKAANLEELDRVVLRVVRSAMTGKGVKDDSRVGEITESERREVSLRKESLSLKYFGFGPTVFPWGDSGAALIAGLNYEVDPNWGLRFHAHLGSDTHERSTFAAMATIGLQYFLTETQFSPYVFANFGYGGAVGGDLDRRATGFSMGAGLGLLLFRTSSTQLDLNLGYQSLLVATDLTNGRGRTTPGMFGLTIGIVY